MGLGPIFKHRHRPALYDAATADDVVAATADDVVAATDTRCGYFFVIDRIKAFGVQI